MEFARKSSTSKYFECNVTKIPKRSIGTSFYNTAKDVFKYFSADDKVF